MMSGYCLPRGALWPEVLKRFIAAVDSGSRTETGLEEEGAVLRKNP